MGRARLIDYDEVRTLWETGQFTRRQLAARFGVSTHPIDCAINPRVREYNRKKQEEYKIPCAAGCGTLVHGRYAKGRVCPECDAKRKATSVRPTTLYCSVCTTWKNDEQFPRSRHEPRRRGRHTVCRGCQAAMRQKSRERRMVPCFKCGTLRINPRDNVTTQAKGYPDTGLCRACWMEARAKA